MKLPQKKDRSPWLRRRTKTNGTIEALRTCAFVLVLFGSLIFLFTPPTSESTIAPLYEDNSVATRSVDPSVAKHDPTITIVACEVSTPHSAHPETAARGKFHIAILNDDIERQGSSAEAFLKLVNEQYYDGNYLFRVLNGFIAQWGFRTHRFDDKTKWTAAKERIDEADVPQPYMGGVTDGPLGEKLQLLRQKQNVRGTITMIRGNTGQVFINIGDNRRLDKDGTIAFGVILETSENPNSLDSGMGLVDNIYHDYKEGQGQIKAIQNDEIPTKFPEMGRIDRCYQLGSN